jgi:repressor LexA
MSKLTTTQEKALAFIRASIDRHGVAPTLREICAHMGYRAVGSAQDIVSALRKKGYLVENERQTARGIVPTDHGRRGEIDDPELFLIPCLGSVPAGNPVEAIEDHVATLRFSKSLLPKPTPRPDELFALRASGDSMIGAGILDGDWLVVRVSKEAPKDSIVVARVDGDVTVKRLKADKRSGWFLQPENPRFKPIYAADRQFSIVGQVLALQRSIL